MSNVATGEINAADSACFGSMSEICKCTTMRFYEAGVLLTIWWNVEPGAMLSITFHGRKEFQKCGERIPGFDNVNSVVRSEEHTSELQSLMRISYAVFCLKKNIKT